MAADGHALTALPEKRLPCCPRTNFGGSVIPAAPLRQKSPSPHRNGLPELRRQVFPFEHVHHIGDMGVERDRGA